MVVLNEKVKTNKTKNKGLYQGEEEAMLIWKY